MVMKEVEGKFVVDIEKEVEDPKAKKELLESLVSLTNLFMSVFFLDLRENKIKEYVSEKGTHFENIENDVQGTLNKIINTTAKKQWIDKALEFVDLSTLKQRIAEDTFISLEYEDLEHGWVKSYLVPTHIDGNYWFISQSIGDEKSRIALFEQLSKTDELTNLKNRRAFDYQVVKVNESKITDLVVVCFDINNLKYVNDTYGHKAGDELIKASAKAINECLKDYGDVYRTGGDEFIAILHGETLEIQTKVENMIKNGQEFKSENFDSGMQIAFGVAGVNDYENGTFYDYERIAETRMNKNKSEYYVSNRIERRNSIFDRRKSNDRRKRNIFND